MFQYKVSEFFTSIQGESSFAGQRCFFIRFVGCNLNCSYCDTRYAQQESSSHQVMTLEALLDEAQKSGVECVELTGGEPLLTPDIHFLIEALQAQGKTVLIETNGSLDISRLPSGCVRIMDVKCPSSNMSGYNLFKNFECLTADDEVKFVISTREDFDYAQVIIARFALPQKTSKIHFSACTSHLDYATLAKWILNTQTPARFHIQLHKIIWPHTEKGV